MTDRRAFVGGALQAGAMAALAMAAEPAGSADSTRKGGRAPAVRRLQRKYAPHFGMFEQHAGPDLVAQLEFMASQGFTALEDNWLMGRAPEVQAQIGSTLARLGMTMGVFVLDTGDHWKTSLTTGEPAFRQKFLETCRNEPGSGEMNYHNLFRHIVARGYAGVFGMEHGNSQPGKAGELGVIDAYLAADSF